jgi:hypothetical protein
MLGKDIMMQMPMQLGKGSSMGGNTNVDTDYKCEQVCNEVCTPTPEKQCQQIPYQTQVSLCGSLASCCHAAAGEVLTRRLSTRQQQACNKVPVQKTKQVCNRTCTKTTTVTEAVAAPSTGKGAAIMMPTSGKYGRRLSGVNKVDGLLDGIIGAIAGKAIAGAAAKAVAASAAEAATVVSSGKGAPVMMRAAAPQVDEECNDVSAGVGVLGQGQGGGSGRASFGTSRRGS